MMMQFTDLRPQQAAIKADLDRRIARVLAHGQYIMGPEVAEIEATLAAYTGTKHCITVASGTEALLIAMMALGIGPGDEVITTPFTFVATVETIVLLGAKPVYVDVDPTTANLDAALLEAKITARTKAIIPVSLYGQAADMDAINAIASRHGGIPVIEDGAQSFGATYKGRRSCALSTIGCTSFFPSKPLGCYGDGGAMFTDDDALAQAFREIRVHGQSKRYVHTRVGLGGRMDTLQCAVLLAKWPRFEAEVAARAESGRHYTERLHRDVAGCRAMTAQDAGAPLSAPRTLRILADATSVFAQYTVLVADRAGVQDRLAAAGIPTAVHYPVPLNEQPAYRHLCCENCTPIASWMAQHVMSLPMGPDISVEDIARVVKALS
ncbi:MAG: DegT/DnrJ/EryC1/StrS family aminotransferase [Hyphomicrobium sp.]